MFWSPAWFSPLFQPLFSAPTGHKKGKKRPVNWSTAGTRKEWESFDRELDQVLEAVLLGWKVEALSTVIWTMGTDCFEMERRKVKGPQQAGENRCSKEISKM